MVHNNVQLVRSESDHSGGLSCFPIGQCSEDEEEAQSKAVLHNLQLARSPGVISLGSVL
jgi:hypothetical protein